MLEEVFDCPEGGYRRENHYWKSHDIHTMIGNCPEPTREEMEARVSTLRQTYERLSGVYQASKGDNEIPLP